MGMARSRLPVVDESLPARIATGLHKIGLAMKQQTWQQANEEGLSATQGQILAALLTTPLTGSELSERIGVTLPTISDSVRVLVEKKLVTKGPDPRHPRASLLTPTKRGATIGARARSWPELFASAVADLSPVEQRGFYAGIVKIIRSLQEQALIPVGGMCVTCTHFQPNVRAGDSPHHCAYVDAPLAAENLRIDCNEHVPHPDPRALWEQFLPSR